MIMSFTGVLRCGACGERVSCLIEKGTLLGMISEGYQHIKCVFCESLEFKATFLGNDRVVKIKRPIERDEGKSWARKNSCFMHLYDRTNKSMTIVSLASGKIGEESIELSW